MSTGRKLLQSSVIRGVNLVLQVVVSFMMTPVILHALGDRQYGFWILAGTLVGYYNLLEFGMGSAINRFVSRSLGSDDHHDVRQTATTAMAFLAGVGGLIVVLTAFSLTVCPLFFQDRSEVPIFRWLLLSLGLRMAIGFPARVLAQTLNASLRYDLTAFSATVQMLAANVFIYWSLANGGGVLSIAYISLVASLLEHCLNLLFVRRVFGDLLFARRDCTAAVLRHLLGYGWKTVQVQLADLLRSRFNSVIIASFLSVTAVTYFSIGVRFIEYFMEVIFSSIGNLAPVFSRYEGAGRRDLMTSRFLVLTRLSVIITVFTAASMVFYGRAFIQRWMGPGFESSYGVLVILTIPYTVELMQTAGGSLLSGISKQHLLAYMVAVEAVATFTLCLIFVQVWGLYGVALAGGAVLLVSRSTVQPVIISRAAGIPWSNYFFGVLMLTALRTLLPLAPFFLLAHRFMKPDYTRLCVLGCIQVLVCLPLAFWWALPTDDRDLLIQALPHRFVALIGKGRHKS